MSLITSLGFADPCDGPLSSPALPKIEPILLRPLDQLVDDPDLQFEMKYDGFRGIAYIDRNGCRFVSRHDKVFSQFQQLCEKIAIELNVQNAIFDGEVIAPDPSGRPIFNRLLRRTGPFRYVAFDLLWLNGQDLRQLPLQFRRRLLLKTIPDSSTFITEPLVQVGSGTHFFELMVAHDLEGIVVKRLSDKYQHSTKWYKYKNPHYTQASGRNHFFK